LITSIRAYNYGSHTASVAMKISENKKTEIEQNISKSDQEYKAILHHRTVLASSHAAIIDQFINKAKSAAVA